MPQSLAIHRAPPESEAPASEAARPPGESSIAHPPGGRSSPAEADTVSPKSEPSSASQAAEIRAPKIGAPRIGAIVFDLDGLMFNTEDLYREALQELVTRRGHEYSQALYDAMMGRPAVVALQILIDRLRLTDTVEQLAEESLAMVMGLLDHKAAPMPGLLDLLDALERRGLPKAIATSSNRFFVRRLLGQFELESRFAFILTAEDVVHGKPHPEIYLTAARRFDLPPQRMLVLEDSATGCKAAVEAGACTVAVPGEHSRKHAFDGAFLIADSLADPRLWQLLGLAEA